MDPTTNNPLRYTFDALFLPDTPEDGSPRSSESESRYSNSSFQLIANSMLRMEVAQLEMMKKREIARLEAQRRRAELEHEMTRMMLQTQTHIASTVSHSRKRKKNTSSLDHHSTTSTSGANIHRLNLPDSFNGTDGTDEAVSQLLSSRVESSDGALLLSMLLSNMI